jgi:ECF sigma factor
MLSPDHADTLPRGMVYLNEHRKPDAGRDLVEMISSAVSRSEKQGRKRERGEKGLEWRIPENPTRVTGLLLKWGRGDEGALERLIPLVHDELHRLAQRCMAGERSGHSLQATVLANEAYLRLVEAKDWQDVRISSPWRRASCAPHPRRSRARAARSEARRSRDEGDVRRGDRRHQRAT